MNIKKYIACLVLLSSTCTLQLEARTTLEHAEILHTIQRSKKSKRLHPHEDYEDESRATICPSKTVLRSEDFPYVITSPGVYVIGEDVMYTGTTPAITVTGLQSTELALIDFCDHGMITNTTAIESVGNTMVIQNGLIASIANNITLIKGFDLEVLDMIISSTTGNGIGVEMSVLTSVSNCSFFNLTNGLLCQNTLANLIENCLFIVIQQSCIASINSGEGSVIKNCVFAGSNNAIFMDNARGWTIVDSEISACGTNGGSAISINNSSNIIVRNNTINFTSNGSAGVEMNNSQHINLNGLAISDTGSDGILTGTGSINDINIINCEINNAAGTGINISAGGSPVTNILIESCKVTSCTTNGIDVLASGTSGFVYNCTVINSGPNYSGVNPALISSVDADTAVAGFFFRNISR